MDLLGFELTLLAATPAFSVQEWRAPPHAGGVPLHSHARTTEAFYVADGTLALWLDDGAVICERGSCTVIEPGRPHAFWNPADAPARYVSVIEPAGFERYFAELAAGLAAGEAAAALREHLAATYDVTILGPPPRPRP